MKARYSDVSRSVFNRVCDRLSDEGNIIWYVEIYYNGSSLRGDVTISEVFKNDAAYKRALQVFNEEFCK